MSRGPVPSQLHLLSNLPCLPVGDKVRFLGCVTSYSTSSARLALAHLYPKGNTVTASVDVSLLLESLTDEKTRVGEYVNVIGYITEQKTTRHKKQLYQESKQVGVQAIVLWSTGPMNLERYEKLLSPERDGC